MLQPGAEIRLIGQGPAKAQMPTGLRLWGAVRQQGLQIGGAKPIEALLQSRGVLPAQGPETGAQLPFVHR